MSLSKYTLKVVVVANAPDYMSAESHLAALLPVVFHGYIDIFSKVNRFATAVMDFHNK